MSPLPTLAMRPLVSSMVLYVDLLVSISTTTTTPSSAGMSAEMRTSCDSPQAWVTEAILSTATLLIALAIIGLHPSSAPMKDAGERDDLREPERVRWRPFAGRFAVYALRDGHQRVRGFDAFHEQAARPQQQAHDSGDSFLRRQQQGFDVTTHRIEQLTLVHQIAIGLCHELLDALLTPREHEFFELAVCTEQRFRCRRLKCHTPFGADDGVAQMDAAPDAKRRRNSLELFDELHRRERAAIEAHRQPALERNDMLFRFPWMSEGIATQHPGIFGNAPR